MSNALPVWAIIPAAGSGQRMQTETPKQYLRFQDKSVLEHCLDRLLSHPEIDGAVIVLDDADMHWEPLEYQSEKPVFTATGGSQRLNSVYSGLTMLQYRFGNEALALVHDAARPLVSHADLSAVINAARDNQAGAILAVPVADTLKRQDKIMNIEATVARDFLWRAMTPQVFHMQPLLNALKNAIDQKSSITDDAHAVEMMGYAPRIVAGDPLNLKITNPGDLELAEMIWLYQRRLNQRD